MKIRRIYLLLTVVALSTMVYAQTPKYSNTFLSLGVDARAFGMSKAMVASVNDVTAGYWNPAGLVHIEDNIQLVGMHNEYFAGLASYNYGAIAYNIDDNSAFSFSFTRFAVDDIPNTTQLVDPVTGTFDYSRISLFSAADYGFFISYAKKNPNLEGLTMGGSAKIITRKAGDFASAFGFGIDFGAQYETEKWKFGAIAKDVTSTFNAWSFNTKAFDDVFVLTGNEIPQNGLEVTLPSLVLGAAKKHSFNDKLTILGELNTNMTFDGKRNTLIKTNVLSIAPSLGFELGYIEKIFFRGGVSQFQEIINDAGNGTKVTFTPTMGVGLKLGVLSLDYALVDVGDVSVGLLSHVVSLKLGVNKQ